jgi:hypothetical protein
MAQFPDVHSFAEGSASQPGLPIADGSDLRAETLKPRPISLDDLVKTAFLNRSDLHIGIEGEFAGWRTWTRDNFESHNGPFWHRIDDQGRMQCAFRVEKKHLNGAGNVHGGCFMAFACSPPPRRSCKDRA